MELAPFLLNCNQGFQVPLIPLEASSLQQTQTVWVVSHTSDTEEVSGASRQAFVSRRVVFPPILWEFLVQKAQSDSSKTAVKPSLS